MIPNSKCVPIYYVLLPSPRPRSTQSCGAEFRNGLRYGSWGSIVSLKTVTGTLRSHPPTSAHQATEAPAPVDSEQLKLKASLRTRLDCTTLWCAIIKDNQDIPQSRHPNPKTISSFLCLQTSRDPLTGKLCSICGCFGGLSVAGNIWKPCLRRRIVLLPQSYGSTYPYALNFA